MLNQIETFWLQKSRVEAIRDGDRNTRFYHLSTIVRRRVNRIEALQDVNGNWYLETEGVKHMVRDYVLRLYTDDNDQYRPYTLPSGRFPLLEPEVLHQIEAPFTATEVKTAIFEMGALKAPGPDGFQALFYQRFWDLIGSSLRDLVLGVLNGREFPEELNKTFIVLIPKIDNPQSVTHLRPIGLCNVSYKTITKVIVNQIKPLLAKLIAPTQCSFVPGRQITDNVVIVQEVLHNMRRKQGNRGSMIIKLDLEKAYDCLRWPFVRETLLEAKIPQRLVEVILNCVSTASFSILWHGECTQGFIPTGGVRQGDPLSPYLFVLCMERLSHLIEELVAAGA